MFKEKIFELTTAKNCDYFANSQKRLISFMCVNNSRDTVTLSLCFPFYSRASYKTGVYSLSVREAPSFARNVNLQKTVGNKMQLWKKGIK